MKTVDQTYRAIVENAGDAIIVVQDRKVVYRNAADIEIVGQTVDETAERNFPDFVAPEDRDRIVGYYEARRAGRPAPAVYEVTRLGKDGVRIPVEVKPHIIDFDGQPATMVVMRDITQRKQAEDERRHLSHELHDEIGQELTGLGYLVERMIRSTARDETGTLAMAKKTVGALLEKVRDLSLNLRPAMLDDLGLVPTLAWLSNRSATSGVVVNFEHSGMEARFDPEVETAVYRVAQEALTNVARHAASSDAGLAVRFEDGSISVIVEDSGVGFDPEAVRDHSTAGRGRHAREGWVRRRQAGRDVQSRTRDQDLCPAAGQDYRSIGSRRATLATRGALSVSRSRQVVGVTHLRS